MLHRPTAGIVPAFLTAVSLIASPSSAATQGPTVTGVAVTSCTS